MSIEHATNQELEIIRLASIVNSSDDAIVSKDLNGIITSWNRSAERMFGYTAVEAIGKSIRMIVPADRQSEEDHVLSRIRQGLPVEHFETIRQPKDGSLIPISLSISPIRDSSGRVVGASKIARDITERKEVERLQDRMARHSQFLVQISTALTRSLDYSETLKSIASCAVPQIADWCAVDVVDGEGRLQRLATAHVDPQKVVATDEVGHQSGDTSATYSPEFVIRTGNSSLIPQITDGLLKASADGDSRRFKALKALGLTSYICVPMISHDRRIGTISFATAESQRIYTTDDLRLAEDIGSRTALAVENAQSYEQLRGANRLKDEFLATFSHELRTPLNAVLGYTRMLKSGVITDEKVPHALDVLERNATALSQIVEDVLDVSRIVAGKVRLQLQPMSLAKTLEDAIATVQPGADAKGLLIERSIDPKVGFVSGDPDRLQQVLWNVLSNAVKFTPRGGRITAQLAASQSDAEVTITDTGMGIPPSFLPHLFERFRQAESGTTRRHGGLGLAIARHILEMHGGTITAASEGEGKGSTFRIRLPQLLLHA